MGFPAIIIASAASNGSAIFAFMDAEEGKKEKKKGGRKEGKLESSENGNQGLPLTEPESLSLSLYKVSFG